MTKDLAIIVHNNNKYKLIINLLVFPDQNMLILKNSLLKLENN